MTKLSWALLCRYVTGHGIGIINWKLFCCMIGQKSNYVDISENQGFIMEEER